MMFNVNRIQLLLCVTLLIHWTSASPSSRFHAQRSAQKGHGSMAGEGTSRLAQSKVAKVALGLGAAGGKLALTKAAGVGLGAAGLAANGLGAAGLDAAGLVGDAAGSGSNAAAGSGSDAATGTGNVVDVVIEEVDDIVTVEDADEGEEEIETIMVDESEDESVSVSGGDHPSVPVTVVDESIPVDTVVEAESAPNFFLISGAQLEGINRLLVSHNSVKQAAINTANTVRTEAENLFLAPVLEALQPLLLAGNVGSVPVVDPVVEVESPVEIIPQVNLNALNRFLVDPINAAANAKLNTLNTLNDLGIAAGNFGNVLSASIIDGANAQLNAGLNIINEAANEKLNRLNSFENTARDILAPIRKAVQPLVLATGPLQKVIDAPAAKLIQDFEDEIVKLLKAKAIIASPVLNAGSEILAPFVQLGSKLAGIKLKLAKIGLGLGLAGGKLALQKGAGAGLAGDALGKLAAVKAAQVASDLATNGLGGAGLGLGGLAGLGANADGTLGQIGQTQLVQLADGSFQLVNTADGSAGLQLGGLVDVQSAGLAGPNSVELGPGGSVLTLNSGIDGTQLSLGGQNGITVDQNGITRTGTRAGQAAAAIGNQIVVNPQTGQKFLINARNARTGQSVRQRSAGPTDISRDAQQSFPTPPSCPAHCRNGLDCDIGDGVGGSEQKLRGKFSKQECIDAVKRRFPSANGFTFGSFRGSCRRRCDCYAEFGMTDWEFFGKETWESCFFN